MNGRWMLVAPLLLVALSGCLNDSDAPGTGDGTPNGALPTFLDDSHLNGGPVGFLPDTVTGMELVSHPDAVGAEGVWINDGIAYLSGGAHTNETGAISGGLRIYDVHDPANPVLLRDEIANTSSRDVDILLHPNGHLYAVLAAGGVALVDVSVPETAEVVSKAAVPAAHNIAVVPNSTIVYNSRSISTHLPLQVEGDGPAPTTGQIDIVDFADPFNPVTTVFNFPATITDPLGVQKPVAATTCHDITFSAERGLAFCAGVTETHVWDISDPQDPQIVQVIDWPLTNIHHGVWITHGGDLLIIGDEFTGVLAPTPTCSDLAPLPTSALWFFDVSDLATPLPVGYYQIPHDAIGPSVDNILQYDPNNPTAVPFPDYCSTHFGTLVEDRDMMVMGWYTAGVALIDFSDVTNVLTVDHFPTEGSVWEARYYKGHVYTGDQVTGMDILEVV